MVSAAQLNQSKLACESEVVRSCAVLWREFGRCCLLLGTHCRAAQDYYMETDIIMSQKGLNAAATMLKHVCSSRFSKQHFGSIFHLSFLKVPLR